MARITKQLIPIDTHKEIKSMLVYCLRKVPLVKWSSSNKQLLKREYPDLYIRYLDKEQKE